MRLYVSKENFDLYTSHLKKNIWVQGIRRLLIISHKKYEANTQKGMKNPKTIQNKTNPCSL